MRLNIQLRVAQAAPFWGVHSFSLLYVSISGLLDELCLWPHAFDLNFRNENELMNRGIAFMIHPTLPHRNIHLLLSIER
jgi:hypothetical protein